MTDKYIDMEPTIIRQFSFGLVSRTVLQLEILLFEEPIIIIQGKHQQLLSKRYKLMITPFTIIIIQC